MKQSIDVSRSKRFSCMIFAFYLGGCASTSKNSADHSPPTDHIVDVLPSIELFNNELGREQEYGSINQVNQLTGFYTKLDIEGWDLYIEADSMKKNIPKSSENSGNNNGQANPPRQKVNYRDQSRNAFARWFKDKSVTRAFTVNTEIKGLYNTDSLKSSTTLVALNHDSSRSGGESWTSTFNVTAFPSPYFKINPNLILAADFKVEISQDVSTQALSLGLDLANTAVSIAQPQTSMLTTLSSDKLNQLAQFSDDAASKLFDQSITEQLHIEAPLTRWAFRRGFNVRLHFPDPKHLLNTKRHGIVGEWQVALTPPRVSMFSDVTICDLKDNDNEQITTPGKKENTINDDNFRNCTLRIANLSGELDKEKLKRAIVRAYERITPSDVLYFPMADNIRLIDYLKQKGAFESDYYTAVLNTTSTDREASAQSFCMFIRNSLYEVGFNEYDSTVAVWAVVKGLLVKEPSDFILFRDIPAPACSDIKDRIRSWGII